MIVIVLIGGVYLSLLRPSMAYEAVDDMVFEMPFSEADLAPDTVPDSVPDSAPDARSAPADENTGPTTTMGMGHSVPRRAARAGAVNTDSAPSPAAAAQLVAGDTLQAALKMTVPKARVTKIADGRSVMIDTGHIIELTGLYFAYEEDGSDSRNLLDAYEFLEKNLKDRFVRVYQTMDERKGRTNRFGHMLAHLVREDGTWIQGSLVTSGIARVYPTEENPEMAAELYAFETAARTAKRGLWAQDRWKILSAEEADFKKQSFQIVEGIITKTATQNNQIYLNFGEDWRKDFTIMVPQEKRQAFSRAGAQPLTWAHRRVRVRGWVQDYNGAMIAVQHPVQIEFLDE